MDKIPWCWGGNAEVKWVSFAVAFVAFAMWWGVARASQFIDWPQTPGSQERHNSFIGRLPQDGLRPIA
jgi:hypothetical protein